MMDIFEDIAYAICYECSCTIKTRAEARWLINADGWDHLVCTECAGKHSPDDTKEVFPPDALAKVIAADEECNRLRNAAKAQLKLKGESISQLLADEGFELGMRIWLRTKEYEVTGTSVKTTYRSGDVYVAMYPVTKKGVASKIGIEQMVWHRFIKLWRRQRADLSTYIDQCEKQDAEFAAKRAKKWGESSMKF